MNVTAQLRCKLQRIVRRASLCNARMHFQPSSSLRAGTFGKLKAGASAPWLEDSQDALCML